MTVKRAVLIVAVLAVAVVGGAAGWIFVSGGSGEPSTSVTAPPLPPDSEPPGSAAPVTGSVSTETTAAADAEADDSVVVFEIEPTSSVATFTLTEELRGEPTTVVGTTSEVAGRMEVDFVEPANSRVGEIVINARTFETGSSFRDRAIRSRILESASDEFELITFTPSSVAGLPDDAAAPFTFTIEGDLTIRDISRPATFEVEITAAGPDALEGIARAAVLRSDFGLVIPEVPQVANVSDEVVLELRFVALPAG